MNYILFAVVIVAASQTNPYVSTATVQKDWRELSRLQNLEACQKAAKTLGLEKFRCINSQTGEEK